LFGGGALGLDRGVGSRKLLLLLGFGGHWRMWRGELDARRRREESKTGADELLGGGGARRRVCSSKRRADTADWGGR
jgi:hypothetical protein